MVGEGLFFALVQRLLLLTIDQLWRDHLHSLDNLRAGINLRSYGQKDPLIEFKNEAFTLFNEMLGNVKESVLRKLFHSNIVRNSNQDLFDKNYHKKGSIIAQKSSSSAFSNNNPKDDKLPNIKRNVSADAFDPTVPESWGRVGRNDPCPCGSGRKYKYCHGKI